MVSKKRKKMKARCPGCGGKLKGKDASCRRCLPGMAWDQAVKAAPAFLAKAYGANVVPLPAPRRICWHDEQHINKASATYCVKCGTELALTYAEHLDQVTKARRAATYVPSIGAGIYDADLAKRNLAWQMLHGSGRRSAYSAW